MLLKPSKAQLKRWSKLRMAKYRHREGIFLAEGIKVVEELFRSPRQVGAILVLEGRENQWEGLWRSLTRHPIDTYLLTGEEWRGISQDKEPEGIMAEVSIPERRDPADTSGLAGRHMLLGYRINNPNNLGALLRTAHWFGIRTVVLSDHSVDVTHPKVVRSSMGSLFHLDVLEEVDFYTFIPGITPTFFVIGTDAVQGVSPHPMSQPAALILGNETHGLPGDLQRLVREHWSIPGAGGLDSLSLPQASAIMIYELTREDFNR